MAAEGTNILNVQYSLPVAKNLIWPTPLVIASVDYLLVPFAVVLGST